MSARATSRFPQRISLLSSWLDSCFVNILWCNRCTLHSDGITKKSIHNSITSNCPRPWPASMQHKANRHFQAATTKALQPPIIDFDSRLRHKFDIWNLSIFTGPAARKALQVSSNLANRVPPRVFSAVLRTWWNGWVTVRRVAHRRDTSSCCLWGCRCDDGDSLEHYTVCPIIAQWRADTLGLTRIRHSISLRRTNCMLLDSPIDDSPVRLVKAALALAAIYQVHNISLHSRLTPKDAYDALNQSLREAARGHPFSERIICSHWRR